MRSDFLKKNITSQASYVTFGYGQVEPNKLSAQKTGQIFAQLPAAAAIEVLEQGQFVKYDYANGVCDFTGEGPWMLVYNETKLYRDDQVDCEFAMIKDNYQARYYSPFGGNKDGSAMANYDTYLYEEYTKADGTKGVRLAKPAGQSRYYNGVDADGNSSITVGDNTYAYDDVTAAPDMYEIDYTEDPFHIEGQYYPLRMPEGTTMVPRVFLTNVGDIFTTNTINATTLAVGDTLKVGATGILEAGTDDDMTWQVVKVYTMPDHQPGVKIMRIK